jgi:hypothetical protein
VFVSHAAKSSYAEANPHFGVDAALAFLLPFVPFFLPCSIFNIRYSRATGNCRVLSHRGAMGVRPSWSSPMVARRIVCEDGAGREDEGNCPRRLRRFYCRTTPGISTIWTLVG